MKNTVKITFLLFAFLFISSPVKAQTNQTSENTFVLLFRLDPKVLNKVSEDVGAQWGKWIGELHSNNKFVSMEQLGNNGIILINDKKEEHKIYLDNKKNMVSGYVIIKAKDLDEAVKLAKGSPVLLMGGIVEVRDVIKY